MGLTKHGTGDLTGTDEKSGIKATASSGVWTPDDSKALSEENAKADEEEDVD